MQYSMTVLVILILLVVNSRADIPLDRQKRTLNKNALYIPWDVKEVPYTIDSSSYNEDESELIRTAARMVSSQLQNLITFTEVPRNDPRYKILIAPYDSSNQSTRTTPCQSYPGMLTPSARKGVNYQILTLIPGPSDGTWSCLQKGKPRSIMKWLIYTLGRMIEFRRGDRDKYVKIAPSISITSALWKTLQPYQTTDADWSQYPFDYCSITMESPRRTIYNISTKAGILPWKLYSFSSGQSFDTDAPYLSNTDCRLIHIIYRGNPDGCPSYDCRTATTKPYSTVETVSPFPIVVQNKTQNLCLDFCKVAPTESAFLLGPYQFFQTYLLFSGTCVAEYLMDWSVMKLKLQTAPQLIVDYFPAVGGPTMKPPVTLAYMTLKDDAYTSYFVNQMLMTLGMLIDESKSLQCTINGTLKTEAAVCPSVAGANGIISPSVATSASPELNIGDSKVYQFVVDAGQTEIKLMDEAFSTTYQRTMGFLGKQHDLLRITAIQVMDDMQTFNGSALAVFGVGKDSKTPYVGFVRNMPLQAESTVPLSGLDFGFLDSRDVQPLKDAIEGSCA